MLAGDRAGAGGAARRGRRRPVDAAGRRAPRRARRARGRARRRRRDPQRPRRPGPADRRGRRGAGADLAARRAASSRSAPHRRRPRRAAHRSWPTLVAGLPAPDPDADVRLWVDRRFTVRGAGTVVTGTLPAGTVARGRRRSRSTGARRVRVRGVAVARRAGRVGAGVARVALNLAGDGLDGRRPRQRARHAGRWRPPTSSTSGSPATSTRLPAPPRCSTSARPSLTARCRPLAGDLVRLTLDRPLPLRVGDRALLRDPGSRRIWGAAGARPRSRRRCAGAVRPPGARRRSPARGRRRLDGEPTCARRSSGAAVVDARVLARLGVAGHRPAPAGDPRGRALAGRSARAAGALARRVAALVARARPRPPARPRRTAHGARRAPRRALPRAVVAAVAGPRRCGCVAAGCSAADAAPALPAEVERAVAAIRRDLAAGAVRRAERRPAARARARPAPRGRGGQGRAAAAGSRPGIVLLPGADGQAARLLAGLPQPFTTSEARQLPGHQPPRGPPAAGPPGPAPG